MWSCMLAHGQHRLLVVALLRARRLLVCRYCPVALLEVVPQRLHWRAPAYVGRSDLETLLASERAADWVRGAFPSCSGSLLSCTTC